jgi:hypothetical protein
MVVLVVAGSLVAFKMIVERSKVMALKIFLTIG